MLERLSKILLAHMEHGIEITRDSLLIADLGLNSYEIVALVNEVEDEFEVEISDRELKRFKTVGDVLDYIDSQY